MKQQWQSIKAWVTQKTSMAWPDKYAQMPQKLVVLDAKLELLLQEEDLMKKVRETKTEEDAARAEQMATGVLVMADPLDKIAPCVDRAELKRKMDNQLRQATHGDRSKRLRGQQQDRA